MDIEIPSALADQRLDRVVSMLLDCSRAQASALVAASAVSVNGVVSEKPSLRVREGDALRVDKVPTAPLARPEPDPEVAFEVVFEDEHLAVIDKPAGLVVHPGAGNLTGTLVNGLLQRYPGIAEVGDPSRPGIVHRLDAGTSGLMAVAKDPAAYEGLVELLATRQVQRVYTALVLGVPEHSRGMIDAPIGRSRRDPLKMSVNIEGKDARTHYQVDHVYDEPGRTALLTCRLETGRTHQIRVHLSSIGHPVVGDGRYGGSSRHLVLERPFLHARELAFRHPLTGEPISCSSELPADLAELLDSLD